MKIGEKIRKIREMKGFSQEYMAMNLAVSQQAYGKIEREETRLGYERLEKIAEVLGITPTDIIGFDDSMIFTNTFNNHALQNKNFILKTGDVQYNQDIMRRDEKIIKVLEAEVSNLREEVFSQRGEVSRLLSIIENFVRKP